jgi:adenylosuccinate lyase
MRRYGIEQPYEKLKALTRGQRITPEILQQFIDSLDISSAVKRELHQLTPMNYIGNAVSQAQAIK